ncbi:DNA polymerase III subunit gamma/tau, partial [Caulobacter sp. 17J65-9]|nr:DNA polymerase III subunit gamma/tau [Caulobacter sp. 17J65-9]
EEALKRLQSGQPLTGGGPGAPAPSGGGGGARAQMQVKAAAQPQALPQITSFDQVVALLGDKRDIRLKLEVEQYVRLVSFKPGAIEFEPAPGCPEDLTRKLASRLREWTGRPWLIAAQGGGGAESLLEREKREKAEERERLVQDPFVRGVMAAFPGTEIVGLRRMVMTPTPAPSAGTTDDEDDD